MSTETIIDSIDRSPLNRGLRGEDWVADPRNISVVDGSDVTLFDYEAPGVYQVHVLFDEARGRDALDKIEAAFRHIFDSGAETIFAMVPDFRPDVKLMARWVGMQFIGKRATDCGVCELYVLTKVSWLCRS